MEELCQPSLNGRGGPIALIAIQAINFGLKNDMIQQVKNSCQFHGLPGGTFRKRRPEECNDLIENMTAHHNDWDTSAQRSDSSSYINSSFDTEIAELKAEMAEINKNLMRVLQVNQQVTAVTPNCETCGGPHSFFDCPATVGNTQNVYAAGAYQAQRSDSSSYINSSSDTEIVELKAEMAEINKNLMRVLQANDAILKNMQTNMTSLTNSNLELKNMFGQFMKMNTASSLSSGTLPSNTITNLKEDLKELANRLISCPVGVAEDVFVKVCTFHFPTDFVVVDFDADPRTGRALINVFEGELTLRVGREAITFNLDQTSRHSANCNDTMAKRIDVIDMACEEYTQEVFGFSDVIASGNPTPYYDPIVSTTSPTLTPFGNNDFLLERKDFLNDDPSLPPPNQGNYLLEVHKELKIYETKSDKSSIDEPLKVELKDLPPHLEYAFLE
nr:hypothetical protein [Tanacetum cinerariifolium]